MQSTPTFAQTPTRSPAPPHSPDAALTLLRRATMGFSPSDLIRARSLGVAGWLAEQLDPSGIDDSLAEQTLSAFPSLGMTTQECHEAYPAPATFDCARELRNSILARAALSKRQLLERTVDFWRDHFNVFQVDGPRLILRTQYERDVLREHAFGNFRDLLGAVAKSPSMLSYLNGSKNFVRAPNENFSRELFELHTLGIDGGYSEQDIQETARCFTGWRYHGPNLGNYGEFTFSPGVHDFGTKVVMGTTILEPNGADEGDIVLDLAAQHPSTARFVSGKLAKWFLGENLPQSTLDDAEATWNATGGDIAAVIGTLLSEPELIALEQRGTERVKRPMHVMTSLMRAMQVDVTDDYTEMTIRLGRLGQPPAGWISPDGFPDDDGHWAATVTHRIDLMVDLFEGTLAGATVSDSTLVHLARGLRPQDLADGLFQRLCGVSPKPEDRSAVHEMIANAPAITPDVLREAVLWIALSPTFLTH